MNRKAFDLVICCALAAVAMMLALLAPEISPARALVALPLVLFAPGYALVAAAFPASRLGTIERLLFSLGASLAVAGLAGLLLHWTALGLRPAAWAVALGNLTLVASLIALVRRWRQPASDTVQRSAGMTLAEGGLLGLALLLVAGALLIARDGAIQQRATGFTQLWVLPDSAAQAGKRAPGRQQSRAGRDWLPAAGHSQRDDHRLVAANHAGAGRAVGGDRGPAHHAAGRRDGRGSAVPARRAGDGLSPGVVSA